MSKMKEVAEIDKLLLKNDEGATLTATELAVVADAFWNTQVARLVNDKVSAALKAKEVACSDCIIAQALAQKITAIGGDDVVLKLEGPEDQPTVKDWEKFYAYVLKTKDFSLLERRPGKAAIKERWEDNVQVPGVDKFPVYKLSKRKV